FQDRKGLWEKRRPRYCPGTNANGEYLCETGHCCGETGCCTYYYELWWFWLLWTVLILFSCCCAYRHRRAKLRVQQQQRQREISLLAYHGANSFPSSMLDLSFLASLKLPSYEEVAAQPSTPPPPYSSSPLAVLSPSSPRSPASLPAPTLLLDPLTSLNQSNRASSLSPSPRATQSPPKQTVFSPCVDVFEPGPPSFDNDEEEHDERGTNEEEDEDMGADESQYRHRRLTGDSGIEVCRCRVEEEDDDEEEEEEEGEKKEEGRRGEGGSSDVHDSFPPLTSCWNKTGMNSCLDEKEPVCL
uniref:Si:ch73-290k24.6 n=1 Tax=Oryzias latipes TaxID=8090 RepID=A0A3B3I9W4_ORYLA